MSWRYVMSRNRNDEGDFYEIREYYELVDDEGDVEHLWTVDPVHPFGESPLELRTDLARMLLAATHDELLDLTLDPPRLVSRDMGCPMCNDGWNAGCGDVCCTPGPCQSCNGTGRR